MEWLLFLAGIALGFVIGARWMWGITHRAIDEFERERKDGGDGRI